MRESFKTITIMNDIIKDYMKEDFTMKEWVIYGVVVPLVILLIAVFVS